MRRLIRDGTGTLVLMRVPMSVFREGLKEAAVR